MEQMKQKEKTLYDQVSEKVWDNDSPNASAYMGIAHAIIESEARIQNLKEAIEEEEGKIITGKETIGEVLTSILEANESNGVVYGSEREATTAFNVLTMGLGLRPGFAGECIAMVAAKRSREEKENG